MKKIIPSIFTLFICCAVIQAQCPTGDITFSSQQQIDDFATDYPGCTELLGDVIINDTTNPIISLAGLSQITGVGGNLRISFNDNLMDLIGLDNITSVGRDLVIHNNDNLTTLASLDNITSVGEDLSIDNNDSLTTLTGLDNITSVIRHLVIRANNNLTTLTDLDNITSMSGHLVIHNNDNLTTLAGLEMLDMYSAISVLIEDNPKLFFCDLANICDYIQNQGNFSISNNAAGCINPEEVSILCSNSSPSCSDDLIIFTSQTQIDSFAINNPGCTAITGDVKIINSTDISSLNGLNQVTSIGGDLWIENNALLADFTGLESLTSIGGMLHISSNPMLLDFTGFENLDYTTITLLTIRDNNTLNICGVESMCIYLENSGAADIFNNAPDCSMEDVLQICGLQCPAQNIVFSNQTMINTFAANYPNCTKLIGELKIIGSITNLSGLSQITKVGGDLIITNNHNLERLIGLNNLTTVGGDVNISNNHALYDVDAIQNITSIGGGFTFTYNTNDDLFRLPDFQYLTSLSHLYISYNTRLGSLIGLRNITTITGSVIIENSIKLGYLDGLTSLTSAGSITIQNNSISSLRLDNLTSINGILNISNNIYLTDLTSLENLTSVGSISITGNGDLTDLIGLGSIDPATITNLGIHSNSNLSLCGLSNICTYLADGGTSDIYDNAPNCNSSTEILDLCDLPIEMIDPLRIRVQDKTALLEWQTATETNNAGFEIQRSQNGITWEKIAWQDGQGTTTNPHSYTHRDPAPFFGTSYYRLRQVDFDETFTYSNTVSLRYGRTQVSVYPNPVKDKLYIQTNEQAIEQILIFDATGRQITAPLTDDTIDVSNFAKGIYMLRIRVKGEDFYEKIMID